MRKNGGFAGKRDLRQGKGLSLFALADVPPIVTPNMPPLPPASGALRARRLALFAASLCLWTASCDDGSASAADGSNGGGAASSTVDEADLDRRIRDLVTAVSPLMPEATAMQERDYYERRRDTLKRDRQAGPALAQKALDAYHDRPDAIREVRAALLDVAAHGLPEKTRPILVELVTTFGEELGLRKSAAQILGKTSPETAVELFEPIIVETELTETYPPQDALLMSWLEASKEIGHDPTDALCDISTNARQQDISRNLAIKALGEVPSERGRQALELVMVESGGNHMSRRYAAQSLQKTLPNDDLCELLSRVFDNESDVGFQQFLASMLEDNCR